MREHPGPNPDSGQIKLGLVYGVLLGIASVGAAIWVFRTSPSRDLVTTVSVAASAIATLAVGLLALVALENSLASRFHWPHIWVLPVDVHSRPDFRVLVGVAGGIIAGYAIWQ